MGYQKFLGVQIMRKFQKSTDDNLGKLPTSREALSQHVRKSCYQAGYLWQDCQSDLMLPKPNKWGSLLTVDLEKFVATCTCKNSKCSSTAEAFTKALQR